MDFYGFLGFLVYFIVFTVFYSPRGPRRGPLYFLNVFSFNHWNRRVTPPLTRRRPKFGVAFKNKSISYENTIRGEYFHQKYVPGTTKTEFESTPRERQGCSPIPMLGKYETKENEILGSPGGVEYGEYSEID